MKRNYVSIAVLAIVIGLCSCKSSSSFDKDVRKMADYRCQQQKLEAKDPNDEKAKKELDDLKKEIGEYENKMAAKYKDQKGDTTMDAKAEKIMKEVMDKCK